MILRPLQPAEAFYRFNTPRWSYRPTSGAGAAKVGGRFNRPGSKHCTCHVVSRLQAQSTSKTSP
jgi:RES domain-containing protein